MNVTVDIDERTVFTKKLMGEHRISCEFVSDTILDIKIGDYITHNGEDYTINRLPAIVRNSSKSLTYSISFEAAYYDLSKKIFMYDGLADFNYNQGAEGFVTKIVENINSISSGWTVGDIDGSITGLDRSLQFANETCKTVLSRVAAAFECEFDVQGKEISILKKIGATQPAYTLEYGADHGLYKLERQQVSDQNIITRVYGFGAEKNLNYGYRNGSRRLIFSDPFEGTPYVQNVDKIAKYGIIEGQYTNDNIFPNRTATLTSVHIETGGVSGFNETSSYLCDTSLDFDINQYLIPGMTAKIVFKSGALNGIEFPIAKVENASPPSGSKIYINSYTDELGYTYPNSNALPAQGDLYTLVDISMPQSYISAAETLLYAAARDYLEENYEPALVYILEMDPKYVKDNNVSIDAGDKIVIVDSGLIYGSVAVIRVSSIEYPLVNPYKIKATISDTVPYTLTDRIVNATIENTLNIAYLNRQQNSSAIGSTYVEPAIIEFTDQQRPTVIDYDSLYSKKYGQKPMISLIINNLDGTRFKSMQQPLFTTFAASYTIDDPIDTIYFELDGPKTGWIIISKP